MGLVGQGAHYGTVQRLVGLLVAAAALLAMVARPPDREDARLLPVVPALALVVWALADAVLLELPLAGPAGLGLLVAGVLAVLFVCRRLGPEDRELLVAGVVASGLVVALTGWLGVVGRVGALAWVGDGIWRASATLTYPNAAAAVLVPAALVVLARLGRGPRSLLLVLVATGLLSGLAATMSRAGVAAFAVGLAVLAVLQGVRATVRAAAGPVAGALVALAGLVPSMPAAAPPRPAVALAGLAAGLALSVLVAGPAGRVWPRGGRLLGGGPWPRPARLLAGVALVALLGGLALVGGGQAFRAVAGARVGLDSPDRTGALLAARQVLADHPLTGAGPGQARLRWEGSDGVTHLYAYVHNEYVQVAAELGLVGLALLGLLVAALARLLWRSRPAGAGAAPWAGVVAAAAAFAVHGGLDFVWHLPAVVLAVTVLAGTVLPPPAPRTPIPVPPRKKLHEATT